MNQLAININFVSNLLSIFYSVIGNSNDKAIQSLKADTLSLRKANTLIEEFAHTIWKEQDVDFAIQELKRIKVMHQLIVFSYKGMRVITQQTNRVELEEYINEFEKLMLGIQSIKNILKNIIRNPQEYEKTNQNAILNEPIWENDERTLESIRKQAWQRTF